MQRGFGWGWTGAAGWGRVGPLGLLEGREEFVNVGVIVSCPTRGFLEAQIALDELRLRALDATLDIATIRAHLATIQAVCAGGEQAGQLGQLSQRERFHWLVAPRSTVIQTSPVHTGLCQNPRSVLAYLVDRMVRPVRVEAATAETELESINTLSVDG